VFMELYHTSKSRNSKQPLASTCSRTCHYSPASRGAGQISDLPQVPERDELKGPGCLRCETLQSAGQLMFARKIFRSERYASPNLFRWVQDNSRGKSTPPALPEILNLSSNHDITSFTFKAPIVLGATWQRLERRKSRDRNPQRSPGI
jgi:hypothetical protein